TWNVVGTAQYLSPEQAIGDQADSRSDLYSVGCLFYELISGKPPFTGDTPVAIAYQHVSGVVTPATQLQPTLNSMVDNFISVALAKSPDDRYQNAIAMLDDLKRLARGEAITREIPRIKKPTKRLKMAALLSVVLLGLGVVANFTIFSKTDSKLSAGLPNVVGLTETQARELLVGFTITINRARDPRIPIDRVVSQLPLATSKVSSGSSVTLTLSDGPGDATVPVGLIGISLEEARILLVQSGLVILRTNPVDSEQVPGTVLVVTPQSGETVRAGSGVVLDIASGNVQVPTLIGVSEIQARTLLIQAGFLVKIVDAIDATQPVGIVLAQAPDGGSVKTIGSSVTITINRAATN
ncbi:MAG: PASTA domain-containing protein, partial [Actinobacteria bacterium]|nr:PASTA domain-containing protein [Actinomycetota bacterium]